MATVDEKLVTDKMADPSCGSVKACINLAESQDASAYSDGKMCNDNITFVLMEYQTDHQYGQI